MSWSRSVVILCIACAALLQSTAEAAGILIPRDGGAPIRIRSHRVTAVVEDGIARTTVRQTFVNPYHRVLEAVYVFPVPEGAALVDLAMETGGRRLEGLLTERRVARRAYERLRSDRIDPALVEQIGRSTFRLSVFPVLPDEPTVVEITWIERAPVEQGEIRYVYPLAQDGEPALAEQDFTLDVTVRSAATITSVASPDEGVEARLVSDHAARATMERRAARLGRDATVVAKIASTEPSLAVKTFRAAAGDAFFSATVTPPDLPESAALPRDITLVLDTSGSMEGEKLRQAKTSALWLLANVRAKDRVNLIRFASTVKLAAGGPLDATPENLAKLREFVGLATAEGGTALGDALRAACAAPATPGRVATVVFLTDGEPTIGEESPGRIVEFAKEGSDRGLRIYTFGVGADVNAALLEGIAVAGRGTSEVFRPQGEVASRLRAFLTRTASPVLTRLRVEVDGVAAPDVFPRPLPDIHLGEQATVTGRIPAEGAHEIVVRGFLGDREIVLRGAAAHRPSPGGAVVVRDLWAKSHLDFLARSLRLRSGLPDAAYYAALDRGAYSTADELTREMVAISLETGVQCAYTSFIALLPEDRARLDPRDAAAIAAGAERAAAKRREAAGTAGGAPQSPAPELPASEPDDEPPIPPEETKPLEESERWAEDPFLRDATDPNHDATDDEMPLAESLGEPQFHSDAPPSGVRLGSGGGRFPRGAGAGGVTDSDALVGRALGWMAAQQAAGGAWTVGEVEPGARVAGDVGATGLAVLAYLAAGETHQHGAYRTIVKDAVKSLRNAQDSAGCFGPRTLPTWRRDHLIAALAMAETYGMTQSAVFADAAQRGVTFALALRRDEKGAAVAVSTPEELEETVWLILVVREARLAGLDVGAQPWDELGARLPTATPSGAVPPAADVSALGAVARTLLQVWRAETPGDADRAAAAACFAPVAALLDADPSDALASDLLFTMGSVAAKAVGGEVWTAWRGRIDALSKSQSAGSWPPARSGLAASRITSTALRTLTLGLRNGYVRVPGTK